LLLTKLHPPPVRRDLVPRQRLLATVSRSPRPRLTLVSAPPGFGKTTLVASWLEAEEGRVAWVSLEESEREPVSFWTYVVTALDRAAPGVGRTALPLLEGANPPLATVLTSVLNELSALPGTLDLVLDDYHRADGPAVADDLAFLLEHLPAQVRVVISTRADPALPLARLRSRGELVEVRAADLRFTHDEVAAYLNEGVGLGLSATDLALLEGRTEGWIAALQLAALSLRGRDDAGAFIAGFAGDDRYVVDYLVEEVLARQPAAVRTFLLDTSVLDRLTGPLCDAVTGGDDGVAVLDLLDRSNLFLVPLDDSRRWYRYHHLFGDVLHTHLLAERPDEVAGLHRRAGRWYDAEGDPVAAVRHLLAAGDVEEAADVVERTAIGLLRERQEATVRRWADEIPYDVVLRRPVLALALIGALMSSGDLAPVPQRLDDLGRLLADPPPDLVVLDDVELARIPGAMATYRAALALVAGDPRGTVLHANEALAAAAPGDDLTISAASALSGLASWSGGDLEAAHRGYSVAVEGLERAGNISDVLGCSITLGDLCVTRGRLGEAERTYRDALALAGAHEVRGPLRGTGDMLVGLSQIALERGDLEQAREHLARADLLGEGLGLPQYPYRSRVARAGLCAAEGDPDRAVALLEEAERVYVGDFSPDVRPVAATRARVLVAQGRLDEALAWVRERHLSPDDDLTYLREYEHVTLARVLLHRSTDSAGTAYPLLQRLRVAAEGGGRTGTLIEILVLEALAHLAVHGRHDSPGALGPFEEALRLAEPEGYVRVFVDAGVHAAVLLTTVTRRDPARRYPRRLLEAFEPTRSGPAQPGLVHELSDRELEVLRLLASDLDGPEIARRLFISLNTLRTHTKNIYAKLGVTSRRAAVTRAGELGLLSL
jgi:LuxR family maltose regulon positive regulatory protein